MVHNTTCEMEVWVTLNRVFDPKIAVTSSNFLTFPVTNVIGLRDMSVQYENQQSCKGVTKV